MNLRKFFPFKELGWENEEFTRFQILKTPWFNIYLHRLVAPTWHPQCHDHPWHFWSLILFGGYFEWFNGRLTRHRPGTVLYRPARSQHNVVTVGVCYSIIVTSRKVRNWQMIGDHTCRANIL
jgi:hypothetical protein